MSARIARQFQLVAEINNACAALEKVVLAMSRQTGKEKIGELFFHQSIHAIADKTRLVDMPFQRYLCPESKEVDYFQKWAEQVQKL